MMDSGCCGGMTAVMFLGGLSWIVVLVGIGILVYALATRWARRSGPQSASDENPVTLVKRRYARGEIAREQYQEMLRDLSDGEGHPS